MTIVEIDEKGRILLPSEIRKAVKAKRFRLNWRKEVIELHPLAELRGLKGKYKELIRLDWDQLEERAEKLVTKGAR